MNVKKDSTFPPSVFIFGFDAVLGDVMGQVVFDDLAWWICAIFKYPILL